MPPHDNPGIEKQFLLSLALTTIVLVAEVVGGLWTGSLALLSDAGHVLMDLLALGLSFIALKFSARPPDERHTFGYHRFEVIAALVNGITLGIISIGIFVEAWERWFNPRPIKSVEMLVIASIGLIVNLVVALILRDDHHKPDETHTEDLNKKSAYLHVLGDAFSSIGVIAAAILIWLTGYQAIDPLISILIGIMIILSSVRVLRSSLHILVEGVPEDISLAKVQDIIGSTPGIAEVHDLHVWNICSGHIALSAHVVIPERVSDNDEYMRHLKTRLSSNFGIDHTTIQIENVACNKGANTC